VGVTSVHGHAEGLFWPVARAFERQISGSGGGGAVCIYYRGRKVVDLWGGVRDEDGFRPWKQDTMAMSFSTSKGITSTLVHLLADRGLIDYDAPVADYWPEFAAAGKGRITVRELLSHRAGLARLRPIIDDASRILDWDYMVEALADAPSDGRRSSAYHAFTYGWLAGELVRRVTGKPLPDVIEEELSVPLELDGCYIGAPPDAQQRAAALSGMPELGGDPLRDAVFSDAITGGLSQLYRWARLPLDPQLMRDALVPPGDATWLATRRILGVPVPAANGLFTARSLARVYALIAEGGVLDGRRYLSPATLSRMAEVQYEGRDRVIPLHMGWRLGYHNAFTTRGAIPGAFGHFGFGGSGAWVDPSRRLAVAMVNNKLGGTPFGDLRIAAIGSAVMAALSPRSRPQSFRERLTPDWLEPLLQ